MLGTASWRAVRLFSRKARAFHRPLTRTFAWGWAWALLATLTATTGNAGSLSYCDGTAEPGAQTQDRLIRVASLVKAELERSGQTVALVARSGLSLQRLNQRYSHAGVSMRASGMPEICLATRRNRMRSDSA